MSATTNVLESKKIIQNLYKHYIGVKKSFLLRAMLTVCFRREKEEEKEKQKEKTQET